MQPKPFGELAVRAQDDEVSGDHWFPIVGEGGSLRLRPDETAVMEGVFGLRARDVHQAGVAEPWELPKPPRVTWTNQRLAWTCPHEEKSGGWFAFGGAALAIAVVANEVSKRRERQRNRGQFVVGQVAWTAVHSVAYTETQMPENEVLGFPAHTYRTVTLRVTPPVETFQRDIVLATRGGGRDFDQPAAAWMASLAAHALLADPCQPRGAEREHLRSITAGTIEPLVDAGPVVRKVRYSLYPDRETSTANPL